MRTIALTMLALAMALATRSARAQNINKFVISDEAAKKTLVKNEISARHGCENHASVYRFRD